MGEGCSLEGGCASCPYMRMNTLAALHTLCGLIGNGAEATLEAYKPKLYEQGLAWGASSSSGVGGNGSKSREGEGGGDCPTRSIAQAGCTSILHMQDFQKGKRFSDKLVSDIQGRNAASS
jgi:quinolinate synthase